MVVVTELENMFFGQVLEGKGESDSIKKVEIKSDKVLSLTMASIDTSSASDEYVPVVIQTSESDKYTICTLSKQHNLLQQPLQLIINAGETINVYVNCKLGNVHLTGYYNPPEDEHDDRHYEDSKDLQAVNDQFNSFYGDAADDDSEDDDEDDFDEDEDDEDEDEDEDDDDDDDDDEEEEEEEKKNEISKKRKLNDQQAKPVKNNKKNDDKPPKLVPNEQVKAKTDPAALKTIQGGVQYKDVKEGSGPQAKKGKQVHVYYAGRLKKNGKQFDKCLNGKPFKFKLGSGEVIKGWDVGVEGMKVGGKRQLIIPAHMAYGSRSMGPDLPANSDLIFDVELKAVS